MEPRVGFRVSSSMPAALYDIKELTRLAWQNIKHPKRRTYSTVCEELKLAHVDPLPSKGSYTRWAKVWTDEPAIAAQAFLPAPRGKPAELDGIPDSLQDALSPRLLYVGDGTGLDKVQSACVKLAEAIASKSDEIAEMLLDTESETVEITNGDGDAVSKKTVEKGKVARSAVAALSQIAQAMHTITQARSMVSLAHRNFGEGDFFIAQAQKLANDGRADAAKDISVPSQRVPDVSAQQEAMQALRGTAEPRK